jgi:hypothetical protein
MAVWNEALLRKQPAVGTGHFNAHVGKPYPKVFIFTPMIQ